MSAVSQAEGEPPDTGHAPGTDVLTAERAYLLKSREFLHLMRQDVLSLKALGGDPISEEYLKAALYHRAEALKDLPGTPLFFGRLDYRADAPPGTDLQARPEAQAGAHGQGETFHIGRRHVHDPGGHPVVIDWRAPVSRPFYRASRAQPMGLALRRRFGFSGGDLTAFEDERFLASPPGPIDAAGTDVAGTDLAGAEPVSRLLIEEIERPRSGPMRDIVATIQPDQDDIVRADVGQTVCVQGAPGTGKTGPEARHPNRGAT
jgi:DNA helicase IV